MNINSFTDEQLLNLINNTILEETKYSQDDLTGAYIQTNIASRNKLVVNKVVFLFGYDKNKNSRQYQKEISQDVYYIWCKAILLKINTLIVNDIGSEFDEINRRMNSKESKTKKRGKEVIGKEVIGKSRTKVVRTSYEKEFSFSLSKKRSYENLSREYKDKLLAKCILSDGNLARYEDFITQLEAKGYEYKNFYKAYLAWDKEKNYKLFKPTKELQLGPDWYRIKINDEFWAINSKTLEIKKGKEKEIKPIQEKVTTKKRDISEVFKKCNIKKI